MLAHTKPRKDSKAQVLLKLRQLSGYDQRHSLQKDMVQWGIPLELVSKLASHSVDETRKYAANTCYELSDASAMPVKLASAEWTSKDLVPLPLAAGSSIEGVPVDLDIFRSPASNMGPAAGVQSAVDPRLAAILSSDGVRSSIKVVQGLIDDYSKNPQLNIAHSLELQPGKFVQGLATAAAATAAAAGHSTSVASAAARSSDSCDDAAESPEFHSS